MTARASVPLPACHISRNCFLLWSALAGLRVAGRGQLLDRQRGFEQPEVELNRRLGLVSGLLGFSCRHEPGFERWSPHRAPIANRTGIKQATLIQSKHREGCPFGLLSEVAPHVGDRLFSAEIWCGSRDHSWSAALSAGQNQRTHRHRQDYPHQEHITPIASSDTNRRANGSVSHSDQSGKLLGNFASKAPYDPPVEWWPRWEITSQTRALEK